MGKVEEVARAVCIACGHEPETYAYDPALRGQCQKVARAAIEAMREPTEKMERAARFWSPSLRETYSEMIDAALSEDKEQG